MRSSFYDVYYAMDKDKRDYVAIKRIPSYADPMFLTNDRIHNEKWITDEGRNS